MHYCISALAQIGCSANQRDQLQNSSTKCKDNTESKREHKHNLKAARLKIRMIKS